MKFFAALLIIFVAYVADEQVCCNPQSCTACSTPNFSTTASSGCRASITQFCPPPVGSSPASFAQEIIGINQSQSDCTAAAALDGSNYVSSYPTGSAEAILAQTQVTDMKNMMDQMNALNAAYCTYLPTIAAACTRVNPNSAS